jgi:6-phosphofructokinase 1
MDGDGLDLAVRTLGPTRFDSPLAVLVGLRQTTLHYVEENDRVLFDDTAAMVAARGVPVGDLPGFEPGGPRRRLFFDPSAVRAGIVTCGGLCPGLNDVIRALVLELARHYGVHRIFGFRNGHQGFIEQYGHEILELTPRSVAGINEYGGTILGTSRGEENPGEIVDCLQRMGISILFVIGGDGSMRGALEIAEVIAARELPIAVVGVPKTIDNDVPYIDHSFGFQTAFAKATEFIQAAHVEARTVPNGVGLVRLMGRHSGFIACYAALANSDADYVLIPEIPFRLDGDAGFLSHLRVLVERQGHAVVVVAEGAGQDHIGHDLGPADASGNRGLGDIGIFLRKRIAEHFAGAGLALNLRYIDPSYAIRSVPANAYDSVYCIRLAHTAVHAAMAGRTEMVVGRWHGRFVHIPMALAISSRSQVDPHGDLWLSVLEATGQPAALG